MFSIGVTSQDKGGYVMVLQFFSGFLTLNWPFSNIFLKYRCRLLGGTKGNLHILIKGSNFACVEIKSTIFFGKIEIMVLNEKMCLNHIFNIQKGLVGQCTQFENTLGAQGPAWDLYSKVLLQKREIFHVLFGYTKTLKVDLM